MGEYRGWYRSHQANAGVCNRWSRRGTSLWTHHPAVDDKFGRKVWEKRRERRLARREDDECVGFLSGENTILCKRVPGGAHVGGRQYFLRTPDADLEKLLRLFTFLPLPTIEQRLYEHDQNPSQRKGQRLLADEVTELVHGCACRVDLQQATTSLIFL